MRKYVLLPLLLIGLLLPNSVKAENGYYRSDFDEKDINEIRLYSSELLSEVRGMVPVLGDAATFELESAIKVYVDLDIFHMESLNEDELQRILTDKNFVWLIPIYTDNATYWVTVTRGNEVTYEARQILDEDSIANLEAKVGKFTVSEVSESEGRYSYTESLEKVLNSRSILGGHIYVLGGTKGYRQLLVVVYHNGENYFLPLSSVMDATLSASAPDEEFLSDTIFSFSEMQSLAKENVLETNEVGGGMGITSHKSSTNNDRYFIGGLIGVLIIGTIVVCCLRRRRKIEE